MKSRHGHEIVGHGIMYGLPIVLTDDGGCEATGLVTGLMLDALIKLFGFDGIVFVYDPEVESYLEALHAWATGDWTDA